jgi:hypothetical protein
LIGVNLLRHIRPTIDFAGSQFVVRTFEPPPPPLATTLKLAYVRGGGMLVRGAFGAGESAAPASLLVDTALTVPMALDAAGFKKAGIDLGKLTPVPNATPAMKAGVLPSLRLGAFDVPQVPGIRSDESVKEREDGLGIELDGLIGSGLLATFRMTLIDGGRSMWLEDIPADALVPPKVKLEPIVELTDEELKALMEEEEQVEPPKKGVPKAPAPKGKKP